MNRMSAAQAAMVLLQQRATFKEKKQGIEWWALPSGDWLAKRDVGGGMVEIRHVPAGGCGC